PEIRRRPRVAQGLVEAAIPLRGAAPVVRPGDRSGGTDKPGGAEARRRTANGARVAPDLRSGSRERAGRGVRAAADAGDGTNVTTLLRSRRAPTTSPERP